MTYEQYWYCDSTLPYHYRKAYEIKRSQLNEQAWLQGLYIYRAVETVAANMNSMGGSKKSATYLERPIPVTSAEIKAEKERKAKESRQRFIEAMNAWKTEWDRQHQQGDGDNGGRN